MTSTRPHAHGATCVPTAEWKPSDQSREALTRDEAAVPRVACGPVGSADATDRAKSHSCACSARLNAATIDAPDKSLIATWDRFPACRFSCVTDRLEAYPTTFVGFITILRLAGQRRGITDAIDDLVRSRSVANVGLASCGASLATSSSFAQPVDSASGPVTRPCVIRC